MAPIKTFSKNGKKKGKGKKKKIVFYGNMTALRIVHILKYTFKLFFRLRCRKKTVIK